MISYISLLKLDKIPDILGIEELSTFHDDNPGTWHEQESSNNNDESLKDLSQEEDGGTLTFVVAFHGQYTFQTSLQCNDSLSAETPFALPISITLLLPDNSIIKFKI
ncbi:hypothetical protein ACH5RR_026602 [Cinchona calisaya]|uniref:Uncharacterized protein n=1 Tax=Cinchona calisaya TaxID=153742 RepID=A0ABD2Z6F7_9GENT